MKFLGWLFSISSRHYRDIRRYENGGMGARIFSIIISLLFIGAALGVEYLFITSILTAGSLGGGVAKFFALILIGALMVGFITTAFEFCGVYAFTAFKMAILGIVYNAEKRKAVVEKNQKKVENLEAELEVTPSLKYKKFDIFNGILQIMLAIGLLVGIVGIAILATGTI